MKSGCNGTPKNDDAFPSCETCLSSLSRGDTGADLGGHPDSCTSLEKLKKGKVLTCCPHLTLRDAASPACQAQVRSAVSVKSLQATAERCQVTGVGGGREISLTVITKAKRCSGKNQMFKS